MESTSKSKANTVPNTNLISVLILLLLPIRIYLYGCLKLILIPIITNYNTDI